MIHLILSFQALLLLFLYAKDHSYKKCDFSLHSRLTFLMPFRSGYVSRRALPPRARIAIHKQFSEKRIPTNSAAGALRPPVRYRRSTIQSSFADGAIGAISSGNRQRASARLYTDQTTPKRSASSREHCRSTTLPDLKRARRPWTGTLAPLPRLER